MARVFNISIDDEVEKALEWNIAYDLELWVRRAVFDKARKCTDEICKQALEDTTHTILPLTAKQQLQTYLSNNGMVLTSVKKLPDYVKKEIVKQANIKSAVERNAELEAEIEAQIDK
jgi:hypothetical protein